ncbi:hypothetical protein [Thermodesulforhabdus norvegica]|uniref:Uncharacterized protein n=1 Tax=Thermodesulforhabdus norvegica TaxID=39841 RepID=A0A1I4QNW0_9BACT|nr:hypothetical protein [Thermodesulforhabdus norvegica]SFM41709.1 hypothetical protein SAMN05660836_00139 [Thermodesulforhabdus norvegica]
MSLYIKTDDYRKYGVTKSSDLRKIKSIVQRELNIYPLYVSFVNGKEFIRVDFLRPRGRRNRHGRHGRNSSHRRRKNFGS